MRREEPVAHGGRSAPHNQSPFLNFSRIRVVHPDRQRRQEQSPERISRIVFELACIKRKAIGRMST